MCFDDFVTNLLICIGLLKGLLFAYSMQMQFLLMLTLLSIHNRGEVGT
jgi:hypothetical protein